jgi:toxin YoeB
MSYQVEITPTALEDIQKLKKSGDKAALKKLNVFLDELREHPRTGTGQPEELKYNFSGCWSRRINSKHRLIYRIEEKCITVIVLSAIGHYEDR